MIYDSITDSIGRTPIVRIQRLAPANVTVRELDPTALEVAFSLPAGAYATAVMRELVKTE